MGEPLGTYYILFNMHKDLSPEGKTLTIQEQAKARQALGMMINRQDLVDYVTMGGEISATGFYPVKLADGRNADVRSAEGYGTWYTGTIEEGNVMFTDVPAFEFSFNTNATNSAIVQYVQKCWNSVGITAVINTASWATLQIKLGEGDAEASRMGWVADFNDRVNFLEIFISASGNNYPRLGQDLGTYTRNTENTKDAGLGARPGLRPMKPSSTRSRLLSIPQCALSCAPRPSRS